MNTTRTGVLATSSDVTYSRDSTSLEYLIAFLKRLPLNSHIKVKIKCISATFMKKNHQKPTFRWKKKIVPGCEQQQKLKYFACNVRWRQRQSLLLSQSSFSREDFNIERTIALCRLIVRHLMANSHAELQQIVVTDRRVQRLPLLPCALN